LTTKDKRLIAPPAIARSFAVHGMIFSRTISTVIDVRAVSPSRDGSVQPALSPKRDAADHDWLPTDSVSPPR
jgi:hypothetical protein